MTDINRFTSSYLLIQYISCTAFKECPHKFVYSTTLYVSIAYKKLRVLYCINKHQQAKQKQKKKTHPKKWLFLEQEHLNVIYLIQRNHVALPLYLVALCLLPIVLHPESTPPAGSIRLSDQPRAFGGDERNGEVQWRKMKKTEWAEDT